MGKLLVMTRRARQLGREACVRGESIIPLALAVDLTPKAMEVYEEFRSSLFQGWEEQWGAMSRAMPFIRSRCALNYVYLSPPQPEVRWPIVHREAS